MKCLKCFSDMFGPDIVLDVNRKFLSINPNKYIDVVYKEVNINKLQTESLSFVRQRPLFEMKSKLSICCLECGYTQTVGENIKLKSKISPETYIKSFVKKRRF